MIKELKTASDYEELVEKMIEYDRLYYDEHTPAISDYEYDQLFKLLEKFEEENPSFIHPESPTQRVSEALSSGFQKREHAVPMLSLANTYSEKEIEDFIHRTEKLLEKKDILFSTELKMDGVAISLRYEKGVFVRALTRGNGKVGDDVSANIKTIKSLPLKLKSKTEVDFLEVRAEVYMDVSSFQKINQERQEAGLECWANPRNAAAGSLKLLDSKEVAKRRLKIVCYGIAEGTSPKNSQFETIEYLGDLGLPIAFKEHYALCRNADEILAFSQKIDQKRKELPFEIDGIVIKVDALNTHKILGVTGKHPRYAVAYKFSPEQAETKILDITVQVGRTGVLTPVAELKPVLLAGSTISRATLHNQDEIQRKDIRIGDTVIIEKGGDVIPKVVKVIVSQRPSSAKPWHMPKTCPACSTPLVHHEEEVAFRCPNPKCSAQRLRNLIFFASKAAMDIEHLGEKVVAQLVEKGLITRPSDFYILDENALAQLEGFKEKSIQNLLQSIEKSKKCPLSRFVMALSIPFVGAETADLLSENFGSLEKIQKASLEELIAIDGIGEKMAESIVHFFQDPNHLEEIDLLLKHGIQLQKPKAIKDTSHEFYGKTFVLTGTLETLTRQEATRLIKEKGGKVTSSVSKNTDYVLAGEDPGSKYEKAKKLNIQILEESDFKSLLG
ncbi:MAG: NAD-dependent DNA ligase LigA [Chlamydiota bacterium]|jgi:DNA ligase (NAD+)